MAQVQKGEHRNMYPPIEPYDTGFLKVSEIHTIYYEQSGNKEGNPVVFVHGGPGSGTNPIERSFFDPEAYRIILFDQRGAGKSTPSAELKENTTWDLVEDMEKLRKHLAIDRWVVFGGSWGSSLSLAYSETHPENVKALIVRGIFTLRREELEWFYEGKGANMLFPDYWEEFVNFIPEVERGSLMNAYYRRLTSEDEEIKCRASQIWSKWEQATSHLFINQEKLEKPFSQKLWALQFARIECHYFIHGGFFKYENQLIKDVDKIRHIPGTIIQGRYDVICPMDTAWQLHKNWPEAEFIIAPDCGHNSQEPGIRTLLLNASDKYKYLK
ncbi:probable proline iminopeptidase [Biomphalaria glabrata]|uniref:Proline iminopeptidase n=1 Tax=Biomphalaria glabrata TaxID=6526 RepID=A0A2C9JN18_BIOGL|nr:probable proline iminopeptidase [Biomphalaria glabrata]KAI8793571.1 proline iminopeptidase [Biomphalaria glabrata]